MTGRLLTSIDALFSSASARVINPPEGVWMAWWLRYQIFLPILLLQLLNLFWYFLIWRILIRYRFVSPLQPFSFVELNCLDRAITASELDDERSDDEGDD